MFETNEKIVQILICRYALLHAWRVAKLDIFAYGKFDIFTYGKFDITDLTVGFDMIFALFSRAQAHIESVRTYRARSA